MFVTQFRFERLLRIYCRYFYLRIEFILHTLYYKRLQGAQNVCNGLYGSILWILVFFFFVEITWAKAKRYMAYIWEKFSLFARNKGVQVYPSQWIEGQPWINCLRLLRIYFMQSMFLSVTNERINLTCTYFSVVDMKSNPLLFFIARMWKHICVLPSWAILQWFLLFLIEQMFIYTTHCLENCFIIGFFSSQYFSSLSIRGQVRPVRAHVEFQR